VRVKKHERSSVLEAEMEMTAIRENRKNFLEGTYFGKSKQLIEDYFVIGIDRENDLREIEL